MRDFKKIYVAGAEDGGWRGELKKVLQHWIKCMEQFMMDDQLAGHYIPYWYNERVHVSFLAGAAWRSKRANFAVEEFRTHKYEGGSRRTGRGDLMMKLNDTFICAECKMSQKDVENQGATSPLSDVRTQLMAARRDVKSVNLKKVTGVKKVGIAFLAPYVETYDVVSFPRLRDELVDQIKDAAKRDPLMMVKPKGTMQTDFWAAYFPVAAAHSRVWGWPKRRWPGVLMLGSTLGFDG